MTGLAVVISGEDRTRAAWASAGGALKGFGAGVKSSLGVLRDLTIVGQGVAAVFSKIGHAIAGTIDAAKESVDADVKLAAALAHTGQEVENNLKTLTAWAEARERATTFDDEATKGLLSMGTQLGLTGRALTDAVSAAQDWSIAMDVDAKNAVKALALTAAGGDAQLSRLKVTVDDNADGATRFAQAIAQMKTGLSEAVGSMPTSAFAQLKNTIGNVREGLGLAITQTKTFQGVMGFLRDKLEGLVGALSDSSKLKAFATAIDRIALAVLRFTRAFVVGTIAVVVLLINTVMRFARIWGVSMAEAEGDVLEFQRSLVVAGEGAGEFFDGLIAKIEGAEGATAQGLSKIADLFKNVVPKKIENKALLEQATQMGQAYTDAFTNAVVGSFDRKVGVKEAFTQLGDDARNNFVGQMSTAAFDPLRQSFGILAQACAAPFAAVGNVVNDVIVKPIANVITSLIGQLLAQIGIVTGAQEAAATTAAAAGITTMTALTAGAVAMGVPLTAAAVAASIASFGAASAFGPVALEQIIAAKALAPAIFAAPLAEGGLVMPAAGHGGRFTVLAEREPEFVVPLSKARDFIGGGGGAGTTVNVLIQPDTFVLSERENERQARIFGNDLTRQVNRARIGGRRRI